MAQSKAAHSAALHHVVITISVYYSFVIALLIAVDAKKDTIPLHSNLGDRFVSLVTIEKAPQNSSTAAQRRVG